MLLVVSCLRDPTRPAGIGVISSLRILQCRLDVSRRIFRAPLAMAGKRRLTPAALISISP
jgi:hypothetical protein